MSYTLKYTGAEIDDILDRAVEGGAIDEELALKAPLESPALTGTPTAPTPAESDNSTKVATTAYADRAAAGAAAAAYPVDTASGAIASFSDGADSIPMKSFVCSIDPIQAGSGDPSPDNIRAISGHSGVNAVVAGKNLWNGHYVNSGLNSETDSYNNNFAGNLALPIKEGSQYTFSASGTGKRIRYKWLDTNKNDLTSLATSDSGTTDTAPTGARYLTWRFYPSDGTTVDLTATGMMEEGSAVSTFEAYNGTTYPVTFYDGDNPLTVYKGSIDLVSGVLTVTHKGVNMGGLNWIDSGGRFYAALSDMKTRNVRRMEMLCSTYQVISDGRAFADVPDYSCYNGTQGSSNVVFVHDSRYNGNVAGLKSSLNGQTLVYDLATPLVYNLTPTEVLSLLGINNCFHDANGNTAVEYRADIALYVQKYLGGNLNTLSMSAPTPSLSLGRTGVLLEPEALEPVITEDAEPNLAEEEPEEPEAEEE